MSRPATLILRSLRASCRRPTRSLAAAAATTTVSPLKNGVSWFEDSRDENTSSFRSKSSWNSTWYFAVAGVFTLSSVSSADPASCSSLQEAEKGSIQIPKQFSKKPKVVFVLGGPGSGKGTQCSKIVDTYGFTHLSAGDLLRAEIKSGSQNGQMIQNTIKEGKIVPSEVTVKLLQKAMQESGNDKFLIDGFPRNDENRAAFEAVTGIEPEFVIFFDCTEEEMERRLLSRNQGRVDDNIETIKKRFRVFVDSSLPVVQYYEKKGKVHKIDANRNVEDIFTSLKPMFVPLVKEDLLNAAKEILQCIDIGDYETYTKLCDTALTAFVSEAQGHLVEGLEFHKFYFDVKKNIPVPQVVRSDISSPHVTLLSDDVAMVAYTRLRQRTYADGSSNVESFNETQVWQRKKDSTGSSGWKMVHFHRSKNPQHPSN